MFPISCCVLLTCHKRYLRAGKLVILFELYDSSDLCCLTFLWHESHENWLASDLPLVRPGLPVACLLYHLSLPQSANYQA